MEKSSLKKIFTTILGILGIYYVYTQLNIDQVLNTLRSTDIFIFSVGAAVLGIVYLLMGERWRQILQEKDIGISLREGFQQLCIANFMNIFVPFRGGDIYRGFMSSNGSKTSLETSIMVIMERVMDAFVVSFLLLISILSFYPNIGLHIHAIVSLAFILLGLQSIKILEKVKRTPWEHINTYYISIRELLLENIKTERLWQLLSLTFLIWLLGILRTYTVFSAIGFEPTLGLIAIITFAWALLGALPLSPSGIGTTDAAVFFIMNYVGVPTQLAGAFIVINRLMLQGFVLLAGGYYWIR